MKELKTAYFAYQKATSSMPEHTIPRKRFSDKSEKELKKCIQAYAKMKGLGFLTYDAKGRKLPNGKWAYSHMTKGAADCILFIPIKQPVDSNGQHTTPGLKIIGTLVVHVEIKMPGDRQKPHQKKFQKAAEERGEMYIMPRSWDTFYEAMKKVDHRTAIDLMLNQ